MKRSLAFIEGIILPGLGRKKIARVSYDYLWTILQLGRWKCTARERPETERPNNRAWNRRTWHFRIWMKMQEMKCRALLNLLFVRNVRITAGISIAYFNSYIYILCSSAFLQAEWIPVIRVLNVYWLSIVCIIFSPHRCTTYVDAAYCYKPSIAWSVGLSITAMSAAKTAEPIEMQFGLRNRGKEC